MDLLTRTEIQQRMLKDDEYALHIEPLLEEGQIGEVSVDLRLGTDFLVSILTRKPFIGVSKRDSDYRSINSYFRPTRREIGDRFILYPSQVALAVTLEYVALPADVYADVISRSSYMRLGVPVNSLVQPGYRGCFPIELNNHGNNPVELVVGSRIVQARMFQVGPVGSYAHQSERRKYIGNVRPVASRAAEDSDLQLLEAIAERR